MLQRRSSKLMLDSGLQSPCCQRADSPRIAWAWLIQDGSTAFPRRTPSSWALSTIKCCSALGARAAVLLCLHLPRLLETGVMAAAPSPQPLVRPASSRQHPPSQKSTGGSTGTTGKLLCALRVSAVALRGHSPVMVNLFDIPHCP